MISKAIVRTLAAAILLTFGSQARAISVGVAGDSYADEYQFYPPDQTHARNFVEILSALRGVDFGTFTTADRGDPRHQGFAYNYGLSGADTGGLATQASGLAAEVKAGNISYVLAFIGGNDFTHALEAGDPTALPGDVATALANVSAAVQTIEAAGNVKIVLTTLPDVQLLPVTLAAEQAGLLPKAFADAVSQAQGAYNADLKLAFAADPNVAINDFASQTAGLFSQPLALGGVNLIYPLSGDTYPYAFVADGIHPGTLVQGVLANSFINALDTSFGATIAPLTPTEIVNYARQIDAQNVPLPAAWEMMLTAVPLMAGIGWIRRRAAM